MLASVILRGDSSVNTMRIVAYYAKVDALRSICPCESRVSGRVMVVNFLCRIIVIVRVANAIMMSVKYQDRLRVLTKKFVGGLFRFICLFEDR